MWTFVVVLYFALFFACSYFTPLLADDYNYMMISRGDNFFIIELLLNLKKHYFEWGGRMLAHFIAGVFLWTRDVFDTSIIYAAFNTLVLFFIIKGCKKLIETSNAKEYQTLTADQQSLSGSVSQTPEGLKFNNLVITSLLILFFTINCKYHYQTMFWVTGSANYLWMFLILISFLNFNAPIFFDQYRVKENVKDIGIDIGIDIDKSRDRDNDLIINQSTNFKLFINFILSVAVGATNENVGLALLAFFGIRFLFIKKYFLYFLNLFVGLTLGTLWLILAPGNKVRDLVANPNGTGSIFQKISFWFDSLVVFLGRPEGLLALIIFGLIIFIIKKSGHKIKSIWSNPFLQLWFLMTAVYIGHTGNFYGRKSFNIGWMFSLFLVDVVVKNNFSLILIQRLKQKVVFVGVVVVLISLIRWTYDLKVIYQFNQLVKIREEQILNQKKLHGQLDITTYKLVNPYDLEDLSEEPNFWTNAPYAKYLNINSLKATN